MSSLGKHALWTLLVNVHAQKIPQGRVSKQQTSADICRMLTLVIANDNKDPLVSDTLWLPCSLVVFV